MSACFSLTKLKGPRTFFQQTFLIMNRQFGPIINQLQKEIKDSTFCEPWFYEEHLLVVEKLATALCDLHPEANREAVMLMVWFHDVGRAHGHNADHDLYGADYARQLLSKQHIDQDLIELVALGCQTHSCEDHGLPQSLEGKILATADAMSHFNEGFFLRLLSTWSREIDSTHYPELNRTVSFAQIKKKLYEKIERDLSVKIFFDEARLAVMPAYQAWQTVLQPIAFESSLTVLPDEN